MSKNKNEFIETVQEYDLPEIYTEIAKFLVEKNMNSDPKKRKAGYKSFIEHTGSKATCEEFENALDKLFNYYFLISFGYDFEKDEYGDFILRY